MAVPALIIAGYLGSGKTTLVQHLLAEAQREGVRLAIISNEFGDTGIDRALLDAGEEGYVELDGGCVCCRLSDALGETLETILTSAKPDRLVLECSGVALPGEVLLSFWRPPIDDLVSEEVVVVLVDGDRLVRAQGIDDTFTEQLEAADLVLLNKCDLLDSAGIAAAREQIDGFTGGQPIIDAVHSKVSPALLFPPDPEGSREQRRDPEAEPHAHTHERFNTHELLFDSGVSEADVLSRVAAEAAIRAKGFVRTDAGVRLVQGVGQRIELAAPPTSVPEGLIGRIVVIRREAGVDHHG